MGCKYAHGEVKTVVMRLDEDRTGHSCWRMTFVWPDSDGGMSWWSLLMAMCWSSMLPPVLLAFDC